MRSVDPSRARASRVRAHAREEHGRAMLLRYQRASSGHGREHCESERSCDAGNGGSGRRASASGVGSARGGRTRKGRKGAARATGPAENALGVCSPRVPCIVPPRQRVTRVPAPKINGPVYSIQCVHFSL